MRNWTSDLRILCSSALPLIHRDSMASEANIMKFVYDFWWLRSLTHALDKTKNILLYFFTELKTSHLSHSKIIINIIIFVQCSLDLRGKNNVSIISSEYKFV